MRVTNQMIFGGSINDVYRNVKYINKLVQQIESTKKIQTPSEDPMISARALKYRTILAETEQFIRNVESGLAWMDITEASFKNMVDNLMKQTSRRLVEAATGTETVSDKLAILTELREVFDQIGVEMNQTYGGRYVFSGFHTDEPPVLIAGRDNIYRITQEFNARDVEKIKSCQKLSNSAEPLVHDGVYIIKLPYAHINNGIQIKTSDSPLTYLTIDSVSIGSPPVDVYDTANPPDTTAVPPAAADVPYYIRETGEIVMDKAFAESLLDKFEIRYTKGGTGDAGLKKGELNPVVYFSCEDITDPANPVSYNVNNHNIQYEASSTVYVTMNSLAKNVYTANMYTDLKRLFDFAASLAASDPAVLREYYANAGWTGEELENRMNEQITRENQKLQSVLSDRINNMLYLQERHASNVMKEHTQLGSRMHRLDMLKIRLEQDEGGYTQLLALNEDTDMTTAIFKKTAAEAVYQASLRTSASIIQLSLVNYIR